MLIKFYHVFYIHTIDVPKEGLNIDVADVFLCKLVSIPPCLAHTLA